MKIVKIAFFEIKDWEEKYLKENLPEIILIINPSYGVIDGNGDKKDGTPGFELIVLIAAIAIALILLRKRK